MPRRAFIPAIHRARAPSSDGLQNSFSRTSLIPLRIFKTANAGQAQFSPGLAMQVKATPRLRNLITEIVENPTGDLSGPALANKAGMSERTFSRSTGTTPAHFVETARIERAKMLLETSDWPLARIAEQSGFGSLHALHRVFRKQLGITPAFYRDCFRTN
ncbi:AraC Family Transcriptional Regulator [Agrobacterium tumefaciens]|nr:AraC Family Transcriptional Regulator [Agrobacterium tumefaciens]